MLAGQVRTVWWGNGGGGSSSGRASAEGRSVEGTENHGPFHKKLLTVLLRTQGQFLGQVVGVQPTFDPA
jgi:hypothetical protein